MDSRAPGRWDEKPGRWDEKVARRRALTVAATITVTGLLLTVVGAGLAADRQRQAAAEQFAGSASQSAQAVRDRFQAYFDRLRDIGAYSAVEPYGPSEQFDSFVRSTEVFRQLPSIAGIFVIQRVERSHIEKYVADMQVENPGFATFELGDAPVGSDDYVLARYVAEDQGLALPVGTVVTTIPSVLEVIQRSTATGTGIAASFQDDPVLQRIARETDFSAIDRLLELDFFIGMPIYPPPTSPEAPVGAASGREPIGWVGAAVDNFGAVVAGSPESPPTDLGMRLTVDLTGAARAARQVELASVATSEGAPIDEADAAFSRDFPVDVEGVRATLTIWSGAEAPPIPLVVPAGVLLGLVGSVLAALAVAQRMVARERDRVHSAELAERELFQRDVLESVTAAVVVLDKDGKIVSANSAWDLLRAAAPGVANRKRDLGRPYVDTIATMLKSDSQVLAREVAAVLDGDRDHAEVDIPVDAGSRHRWYATRITPRRGRQGGAVVVHTDITERKRSQDELAMRASRDPLTGLLNRDSFLEELQRSLGRARAQGRIIAVLFIDLDGFKPINDTFGHATGDEVLRTVAQRITGMVRTNDRVARLGGDEFVVLLDGIPSGTVAEQTAARMERILTTPVHVSGRDIPLRASIGAAVVEAPLGVTADELMNRADQAMYAAKQEGGGRYRLSR